MNKVNDTAKLLILALESALEYEREQFEYAMATSGNTITEWDREEMCIELDQFETKVQKHIAYIKLHLILD